MRRLTTSFLIIAATSTVAWAAASLAVSGTIYITNIGPAEDETESPLGYYDGYGIPVEIQFAGAVTGTATFLTELHVDGVTGNGVTSSTGTAHITSIDGDPVSIDMVGRASGTLEAWISTGRIELHAQRGGGSSWIQVDLSGYVFGPWTYAGEAKYRSNNGNRGQKKDDHDARDDDHGHGRGRGHRGRG